MENNEHILSLSYGKDSLACLGAIEQLKLPLDRIVHVEVWATDTIPADLPPMVEFKAKADKIIKERYGIEVEHIHSKPYDHYFYQICNGEKSKNKGKIYGFPLQKGNWCNNRLKTNLLKRIQGVQYIGIASDEPNRFHNLNDKKISPLVLAGWTEQKCKEWCIDNDLLSPIYTNSARGGCWFCHNQGVEQLRLLRKNYPEYWKLLLKWDKDSFVSFKGNGITVEHFEKRFTLEDKGLIDKNEKWRFDMKEYKRLTKKGENGYGIDGKLVNQKQGAFDVCIDSFMVVLNRLAELEDKIENGTLVEQYQGEWLLEKTPDGKPYCFHCSVCDGDFEQIGNKTKTNYCPNCGAKMKN